MRESGYYPTGAEFDPRAPYNEPLEENYEFIVTCDYYDEGGNYIRTDDTVVTLSLTADPSQYNKQDIKEMLSDNIVDEYYYPEIINYEMVS